MLDWLLTTFNTVLVVAAGLSILLMLTAFSRWNSRRRSWRSMAEDFGWVWEDSHTSALGVVLGEEQELPIRMESVVEGEHPMTLFTLTHVTPLGLTLSLRRRTGGDVLEEWLGRSKLKTGDVPFDNLFALYSPEPEASLRFLNAEVRQELKAIIENISVLRIEVTEDTICCWVPGFVGDPAMVRRAVRALADTSQALSRRQAELQTAELADPVEVRAEVPAYVWER